MKKTFVLRAGLLFVAGFFLAAPALHADVIDPNGGQKNFHYGPNGPVPNGQDDNVTVNPSVEPVTVAPRATPTAAVSAHKKKAKKLHSTPMKAATPVGRATPSK